LTAAAAAFSNAGQEVGLLAAGVGVVERDPDGAAFDAGGGSGGLAVGADQVLARGPRDRVRGLRRCRLFGGRLVKGRLAGDTAADEDRRAKEECHDALLHTNKHGVYGIWSCSGS
jgi:hypothetical protein